MAGPTAGDQHSAARVFGGSELLLRVCGYGFDPHFFKPATVGGRSCFVGNEDFGLRFFPRGLVRFPPPLVMPATKAPDTFRIFIFGESAAIGDPRPNYGAGCYLEVLLAERYPQAKFEIINTGVTAINSHAILPIARECARHQGDLWLIYMGNNEMVGPFGAVTVFGAKAPPLWLARAQLQLRRLRFCQLLLDAAQKIQKVNPGADGWRGMEMFAPNQLTPNDPGRQRVYRNFERNLNDIVQAGLDSGARVVLSTVAVNLKDCPPFGAVSPADLAPAGRAAFEQFCRDGAAAQRKDVSPTPSPIFSKRAGIFPQSAEAQYQLAACLLRLTNAAVARPHFQQAVDDDPLPFRADSRINETIRAAARRFAGGSLELCDAAEALTAASPEGVPGEELFFEHVHLNPAGNYALAVAWAGQIEKLLAPALKRDAQPAWATPAECEQWLGFTDWNRVSILENILQRIQRPPFSGQSGHAQQVARLQDEIAALRERLTDAAAVPARETYLRALRRAPENFRLHEAYAEFLEARHDWTPAVAERKKVCELVPGSYFPRYSLGVDLKEAGALPEARDALLQANALKSDEGDIHLELGAVRPGSANGSRRGRNCKPRAGSAPRNRGPRFFGRSTLETRAPE